MATINLSDRETRALAEIDEREIGKLVDESLSSGYLGQLNNLPLYDCGEYVAGKLRRFSDALAACRTAKSAQKRETTLYYARKAGSDLSFAVGQMKRRFEEEQCEGQLFRVFDGTMPPFSFSESMSILVSYQWRRSIQDDWSFGSIRFDHKVRARFDYRELAQPKPKRKPTARKLAEDRENELRREWEHLDLLAHTSVRDYFRAKLDGAAIPEKFKVTVSDNGNLNNFSADFWGRTLRS